MTGISIIVCVRAYARANFSSLPGLRKVRLKRQCCWQQGTERRPDGDATIHGGRGLLSISSFQKVQRGGHHHQRGHITTCTARAPHDRHSTHTTRRHTTHDRHTHDTRRGQKRLLQMLDVHGGSPSGPRAPIYIIYNQTPHRKSRKDHSCAFFFFAAGGGGRPRRLARLVLTSCLGSSKRGVISSRGSPVVSGMSSA